MDESSNKIYAVHVNYVTVWSLHTCTCQGLIESHNCCDATVQHKELLVVGSHSKLLSLGEGGGCELSLRSAGTLAQLKDGRLAVGGSEGMVDLLVGRMRQATLVSQ